MVTDSTEQHPCHNCGNGSHRCLQPLGLGRLADHCTSLISGFMAKESVVSTLEILFAGKCKQLHCTTLVSCIASGIQSAVYALRSGNQYDQERTWRKMGHCSSDLAVCDCLGSCLSCKINRNDIVNYRKFSYL